MTDMTVDTTIMMLLVIAILPITGILMAIIPYLVKKSEVFAVTVPEASVNDPFIKKLKRQYALIVGLTTIVFTVLMVFFLFVGSEMGVIAAMTAGVLLVCVGCYALMLFYRKKVREYKASQGWVANQHETTAVISTGAMGVEIPHAVSLNWNWLYVPIFIITAAVGYLGYDSIPQQIPMNIGLDGTVSTWAEKTPLIIWIPVIIQAFLGLCFAFSHWMITRSKRLSEPNAPVSSALAYGMFAHAQSLYLVVGGLILAAMMMTMPFTFMGVMTLMQSGLFLMIAALILVIGALAIGVIYGQGGARVLRRMQESNTMLADEDRHWKLGIIYFNPNDPNWVLPARFGVGWTVNFARPVVWGFFLGLVVLTLAFIVVLFAMM